MTMHEVIRVQDETPAADGEPHARSSVALFMGIGILAEQSSRLGLAGSAEIVRGIIEARNERRRYFSEDLFSDPAWDILLELYALRCDQRRTSVSKLSHGPGVPTTTALRWIDRLQSDGLVEREPDPLDGRRVWIELSDRGARAMQSYLQAIGGKGRV
jgi:DNA-binding MarR family transcriptional regulator